MRSVSAIASLPRAVAGGAAGDPAAAELLGRELAAPGRAELALCHAVADGLVALCAAAGPDAPESARRVVERYCLDRKLREALREAGVHGDEAHRGVALSKALLPRLAGAGPGEPGPGAAARVVAAGAGDEELRGLVGVNLFDGVTWFNKERFEEAASLAALLAATGKTGRAALAPARLALDIIDAAQRAGYDLGRLLVELGAGSAAARKDDRG